MIRAAVLTAVGSPLEITGIELPEPGPGRVKVRLAAAGVCHSDLSLSNGTMKVPVPAALGHEGAGTVVAVARRLRTGQVEVNGGAFNPNAPFGGYKQSGIGREYGTHGFEEFLETKSLQL